MSLDEIHALLTQPDSEELAGKLREWADSTRSAIKRGDLLLGILTPDVVSKIPIAYEKAAACGDQSSLLRLAWWYASPDHGDNDVAQAEAVLEKAIEARVAGAQIELVKIIWFFKRESAGQDQQRRTFQLLSNLCKQADEGGEAHYYLGLLMNHGFGTKASPKSAQASHQAAVELGNVDAMFELSLYYAQGIAGKQDKTASLKMCQAAAEAGHPRAMYNLGAYHASGQLVPKDIARAIEWYEKASAKGNPSALVGLAAIYGTGDGIEKDLAYAEQCLDQAEYLGLDVTRVREYLEL
ncbi:MAG: sel1 repeat family protein [Candidatus Obscuribacterales bacterium]|nr:sel1 repeat family protein [Candidatus Obscuribacterales bacterium]